MSIWDIINVYGRVSKLEKEVSKMAYDMTALDTAMETMGTAIQDIIAEIQEWIASSTNTVDQAKMQAIIDKLNTGAASLKAAKQASDDSQTA